MNWNPIETAPKDGTRIVLLFSRPDGARDCCVCYWHPDGQAWCSAAPGALWIRPSLLPSVIHGWLPENVLWVVP